MTIAELTDGEPVLDPYGQGAAVYLKCAEHLRYACEDIFAEIERRFPDRVHTDGSVGRLTPADKPGIPAATRRYTARPADAGRTRTIFPKRR